MNKKIIHVCKVILKRLGIVLLAIVAYILIVSAMAYIPVNRDSAVCKDDCVEVYLLSNGVHTDVVLPVITEQRNWNTIIDPAKTQSRQPDFKYISIGWGDKGFYLNTPTWGDLTFGTAFKALFYLGESAMHVTFYNTMTESDRCHKMLISKESYAEMITYIDASFKKDTKNRCQYIENAHYGNRDVFVESQGKYSLFYTCNTWTNNCLKAGNLKACLWTVLDKGIFYHYR